MDIFTWSKNAESFPYVLCWHVRWGFADLFCRAARHSGHTVCRWRELLPDVRTNILWWENVSCIFCTDASFYSLPSSVFFWKKINNKKITLLFANHKRVQQSCDTNSGSKRGGRNVENHFVKGSERRKYFKRLSQRWKIRTLKIRTLKRTSKV